MKAWSGFGFLETKEGSFLKISEGIGGGLGVGIGLRWRLLSGMPRSPLDTFFCTLFSPELEGMQRRRKECTGGEEVGNSGLSQVGFSLIALSGSLSAPTSLTELKDAGLYEEKLPARALKKFESNGVALQQRRRRGDRHSMPPDLVLRWRSRRAAVDRNDGGLNLNGWREICSSELAGRSCRKLS